MWDDLVHLKGIKGTNDMLPIMSGRQSNRLLDYSLEALSKKTVCTRSCLHQWAACRLLPCPALASSSHRCFSRVPCPASTAPSYIIQSLSRFLFLHKAWVDSSSCNKTPQIQTTTVGIDPKDWRTPCQTAHQRPDSLTKHPESGALPPHQPYTTHHKPNQIGASGSHVELFFYCMRTHHQQIGCPDFFSHKTIITHFWSAGHSN